MKRYDQLGFEIVMVLKKNGKKKRLSQAAIHRLRGEKPVIVPVKAVVTKRERKIFTSKERRLIIEIHGSRCYLCGGPITPYDLWHIDHVMPFSKGGSDEIENLRPTHPSCNEIKGDKMIISIKYSVLLSNKLSTEVIHRLPKGVDK